MSEGEFKKRIKAYELYHNPEVWLTRIRNTIDEAKKEYPQTKQVEISMDQYGEYDFEAMCKLLEQKIIEFENFGKK